MNDSKSAIARDFSARDVVFVLALFGVALALRVLAIALVGGEAVWDGHYYDFGARHIASGFGYADEVIQGGVATWHPWCHYPVGYSAFLAVFYKLFGASRTVAHGANALVGALLAVVTYGLGRHALSPQRAQLAGALVALHPGLILYSALSMSEPLSALLALAAFYVTVRVAFKTSHLRVFTAIALGGLVLGVGALVRPQALLCAPFLALPAFRAFGSWRKRLGGVVLACVFALVPVLPWTARNCRVMDGCALVSTNAGWNLAIGSFPRATGRFETLRSEDGCREVTGQVQQDRCWFDYGVANITRAPLRWLKLMPAKLAFTFDHESFAVEYLHEARPAAWPETRRKAFRDALTLVHRVLIVAAAFGFVARPFQRARTHGAWLVQAILLVAISGATYAAWDAKKLVFWPFAIVASVLPWLALPGRPSARPALLMSVSLLASTVLTHAVFFGEDRYHVVVTPVLCLLAASAFRPSAQRPA